MTSPYDDSFEANWPLAIRVVLDSLADLVVTNSYGEPAEVHELVRYWLADREGAAPVAGRTGRRTCGR
jgi:hypothetical protein